MHVLRLHCGVRTHVTAYRLIVRLHMVRLSELLATEILRRHALTRVKGLLLVLLVQHH